MALLVKLGFLGIRAGTKWVSKRIKREAQRHPTFKRICIHSAQNYQSLITMTNVKILPNVKIKRAKPLSDTEAIEIGAEIISEMMIWSAATMQVIAVYYYQSLEKEEKAKRLNSKFENIQDNYDKLKHKFEIIDNQISNIKSYIAVHSRDDEPTEDEYNNLLLT